MAKKLVLVVDDDRDIREAISTALRDAGYPVLCAANGEVALEILRLSPREAGLILLDLMMPVMDGWEFRAKQIADPHLSGIPVVVLSAGGQVEKKAQNLGATGWLKKPFLLRALLEQVETASATQKNTAGSSL